VQDCNDCIKTELDCADNRENTQMRVIIRIRKQNNVPGSYDELSRIGLGQKERLKKRKRIVKRG